MAYVCSRAPGLLGVESDDVDWDPYFGAKLIRARQHYYTRMKPMNTTARAAEELELIFA